MTRPRVFVFFMDSFFYLDGSSAYSCALSHLGKTNKKNKSHSQVLIVSEQQTLGKTPGGNSNMDPKPKITGPSRTLIEN